MSATIQQPNEVTSRDDALSCPASSHPLAGVLPAAARPIPRHPAASAASGCSLVSVSPR